jgi:hypothetical protein
MKFGHQKTQKGSHCCLRRRGFYQRRAAHDYQWRRRAGQCLTAGKGQIPHVRDEAKSRELPGVGVEGVVD